MGRKRAAPEPEERLVATVTSWCSSYYIGQHGYDGPIDDEAITTLHCEVVDVDARHRLHIGQPIEVSLVCARRYEEGQVVRGHPSLFYVDLRKNQRSLLSYLPADAFWSLPTLLTRPPDPCIEVSFVRLHRGSGALRSIWMGSYEQLLQDRAELAELNREK